MKNVAWVFVFVFCCSFVFAAYSDDGKYISRYDVDNETACGCSIAGAYLMWGSPSDITASCTYYHEPEDTVEGAQINYLHASFTNWDDAEDTKDVMESHKEKYASDLGRTEKSDSWVAVERFVNKDSFSLITRPVKVGNEYRNGDKKQFSYEVNREVRYDDYALITIRGRWRTNGEEPQDSSVIATIDSMEACMKGVIDRSLREGESGKASISVEQQNPFPYLSEQTWLSSSGSLVGGEVRATVLDEDGDGDKGKLVVFYIEKDDLLHGAIASRSYERFAKSTTTWREIEKNVDNVDLISYVGSGVTNKDGVVSINYLFGKRMNMQKLSAKIIAGKGEVAGKIHVAVVDLKKKEVVVDSSVDLKFDHIAEIVRISGKGVTDVLPAGDMQGVVSGPGQVRVKRVFVEPLTYLEAKVKYKLMPGDIINVDADSEVEIVWVNGDTVVAKFPRYVSVAEKVVYPSANLVLLADAYSSGFASTLDKVEEIVYGITVEKGVSFLIDTVKSEIPGSGVAGAGYDFIANIASKMDEYEAADLSKFSIISRIRVKSQFVVDTSGDEMKISVIEGNPDVEVSSGEVSLQSGEAVVFGEDVMGDVESSSKSDFESWEIPEVRVGEDVAISGGFSFGWFLFLGVVGFILWLVVSGRKKNGFKDKLSRMVEGK